MIGAPLVLAVMFSFAFVLWQPADSREHESAAASKTTASNVPQGAAQEAPGALPDMPLAKTGLPSLEQVAPTSTSTAGNDNGASSSAGSGVASATNNSSRIKTANPQQTPKKSYGSGSNSTSPQTTSSSARQQYISPNQPINVQVNVSVPSLTNFLNR